MLHKTRGIVFKTTDYSESSVIVQVLTEKFGLQSYLINGVKKPKAKIRKSMLQPLHLLDMVAYHKESGSIQRISELRQFPVLQTIPYDIIKSSIVHFLNEMLYKSVKQQGADQVLFDYIFHAVELLDGMSEGLANFHLHFLLRLTRFLGFYPDRTNSQASYFDLKSGAYSNYPPVHLFVLEPPLTGYWTAVLTTNFEDLHQLSIPSDARRALLEKLVDYYRVHIDNFGEVRSLRILEEVLS